MPSGRPRSVKARRCNWPTGAGGKGNEGVAAFVQRLPNSIGYVEYAYAKQNKMTYVLMKNKDGNFVEPDDDGLQGRSGRCGLVQELLPGARPSSPARTPGRSPAPTFILMHKAQDKPASASNALKFFDWAYDSGDKMADDLDYVPLPDPVKDLVRKQWADRSRTPSGKAVAFK